MGSQPPPGRAEEPQGETPTKARPKGARASAPLGPRRAWGPESETQKGARAWGPEGETPKRAYQGADEGGPRVCTIGPAPGVGPTKATAASRRAPPLVPLVVSNSIGGHRRSQKWLS